ncbi:MAG: hypothetical protein KJZ80_16245 [Hyphomicrobiaceae bacterium]|nr:hypothetical protein [Hyphomicrobiaceae bacterium]
MKGFKEKSFAERRGMAASAKSAALQKFRASSSPDNPVMQQRLAERKAIAAAREARRAAKIAEQERLAAEQAARQAAEEAERRAREDREAAEQAELEAMLDAERKAARDARYAARKARKKGG